MVPAESTPWPPKSQTLPNGSVKLAAPQRAPGRFVVAPVPCVPYTPLWLEPLEPPRQIQLPAKLPSLLEAPGTNSHTSFRSS